MGAVVNGLVYEWYLTWNPDTQFATLAVGGVVAVLIAGSALGYRLHVDAAADRSDHQQTLAADPHTQWVGQLTEQRRGGDPDAWRQVDEQPRRVDIPPVESTVDRIFASAFGGLLPQRRRKPVVVETPPSAVGRAVVRLPHPPVTDPADVDVETLTAALNTWAKSDDRTALIPPVVSWRGYRQ